MQNMQSGGARGLELRTSAQVQPKVAPIAQKMKVNGTKMDFEVDTGCGVTIICKEHYSKLWKQTDMPNGDPAV